MSDDARDDSLLGSDELRALAEVRSALEGVEREQGRVLRERRKVRERLDSVVRALGRGGILLTFDTDGELAEAGGDVEGILGIRADELVGRFSEIADEEAREALDAGNRQAASDDAVVAESEAVLRVDGGERTFHWVHVPKSREADDGGVDVIGLPAVAAGQPIDADDGEDPFEMVVADAAQRIIDKPGDAAIEHALAAFGEAFGADRVVINHYREDDRRFSVRASWLRGDTPALQAEGDGIAISEIPWAYAQLGAGELVTISTSGELSPDAVAERRLYASRGVQTSLLIPIRRNDALAGYASVQNADADRDWDAAGLARARRFGTLLSGALAHAATVAELEEARGEADDARRAAREAEHRIEQVEAKEKEARRRADETADDVESSRARAIELEAEVEAAREEARRAREDADAADGRIREAENANDDSRSELDGLRRELADARSELDELQEEAERAQRRAEDTAADALVVRKELEEARAEADEARREAAEARAELRATGESGGGAIPVVDFDLETDAEGDADQDVATPTDDEPEPEIEVAIDAGDEAEPEIELAIDVGDEAEPEIELAIDTGDEAEPEIELAIDVGDEAEQEVELAIDEIDTEPEPEPEPEPAAADEPAGEAEDFDPDATVELGAAGFDPDATLEIDSAAIADQGGAAEESVTDEGDAEADATVEIQLTQAADPADAGSDLPRALGLDEILERTQTVIDDAREHQTADEKDVVAAPVDDETIEVAIPSFLEGDAAAEEIDEPIADYAADEAPEPAADTADFAADVEAARELARQVAGKDDAEPEHDDASVPEPAPVDADIPALPGIDPTVGLQEVGGNLELYRNLLSKFRVDYLGASTKIESAISKGNIEVAHLLLHAIKGVAGMLGAQRVRAAAEDLETNLIGRDETSTEAALEAFNDALAEALDSIGRLEGGDDPPPAQPDDAAASDPHVSDPMVLRSYLSGLRQHLLAEKPKQCQLVMREITARTWPGEINDQVTALAEMITADQFEQAREIYDTLMARFEDED